MLVEKGAKVLITGRSENKIEIVKQSLGVMGIYFDISDLENIATKTKECINLLGGRVDVLINNAGIGDFRPLEKVNITNFKVFNTNVFGLALLTKEIIPTMKKQNQRTIINIGVLCSVVDLKTEVFYAASKFALRALSPMLASKLRPRIRVCQVNPSEVTTAFAQKDRKERKELDHKLSPTEIAHTIISIIEEIKALFLK